MKILGDADLRQCCLRDGGVDSREKETISEEISFMRGFRSPPHIVFFF
jgi:hypothetical protein